MTSLFTISICIDFISSEDGSAIMCSPSSNNILAMQVHWTSLALNASLDTSAVLYSFCVLSLHTRSWKYIYIAMWMSI